MSIFRYIEIPKKRHIDIPKSRTLKKMKSNTMNMKKKYLYPATDTVAWSSQPVLGSTSSPTTLESGGENTGTEFD
jgi:hypothetical protein